jgi:hypothetical protein
MDVRFLFVVPLSFALLAAQPSLPGVAAQASTPQTPNAVAIVELFTSEGCSSCPPADALLRQIHGKRTAEGQLIVGISEHVTYWNHLSWKDPYSAEVFTNRQNTYASRLSPEGPHTPQMVLNGHDQFVGSNGAALEQALRNDSQRKHMDLQILSAKREGEQLTLKFAFKGPAQSRPLDLIAVLTDDVDRSDVLRGENSGRSLQHVAVARSLTRVGIVNGDSEQSTHVSLPEGFHGSASGHHLVLFALEQKQGAIVAAATMPI